MSLFNNKYRIESIRLKDWDYSSNGCYFITINTKNGNNYLGDIKNSKITPFEIGKIAEYFWKKMQTKNSCIILDEFILMPNHIHGIILIEKPTRSKSFNKNQFSRSIKGSISMIISQFKSEVKKWSNKNNVEFEWQRGYYERIIRNENEYLSTKNYIINNPINWISKEDNH